MKMDGARLMIAVLLWINAGAVGWSGEGKEDKSPPNEPVLLFPVEVAGKWGYMDPAGNVMITPQYECAFDFSEGLACVQVGLLRGYIDQTGTMVIKPKFAWSGKFSGGRVAMNDKVIPWGDFLMFYMQWGSWGYADTKGNRRGDWPIPDSIRRPPDFRDRFANGPVPGRKKDDPRYGLWGYYDRSGQVVIEPQYEEAGEFGDGLAPVAVLTKGEEPPGKRDGQWLQRRKITWGFIDKTGKMVIEPKYEDAWSFSEGLAGVRMGGKWDYVNKYRENGLGYSEQVWIAGKWGYVDKTGEVIAKGQYDFVWPFSEGWGRVLLGGKHGYVDEKGQEIIKPQFDGAWEFSKGLARVIVGENEWYINRKGEYVWDEAKRKIHEQFLALRTQASEGKGKEAAAKCRAYLKEHAADAYFRGAGLPYLAEIAGADAFDELRAAVEGADPVIREIAARALTTLAGEGVTQKLTARVGTVQAATRATYLKALGIRGDKAGLAVVRENIKDKNEGVRLAALAAIRPLGGAEAIPDLLDALKTDTPAARAIACRELGELPDKEATAALGAALPEAPVALRAAILRLLAVRDVREAKKHIAVVLAELAHADPSVRCAACEALAALGGEKELPTVIGGLLKAQSDEERGAAEKAAAEVVARGINDIDACAAPAADALTTASPAARAALLRLLGKIGGGKAFAAVEAAAKDADAEKRDAAVKTLIAWPDGAATEAVLALARTSADEPLRELARLSFLRLLGLPSKREPAKALELCVSGMEMAKQTEEKKRVIACIGRIRLLEAMKTIVPHLDDGALRNDAAAAMVNAGAILCGAHPTEVKAYMQQIAAAPVDKNTQQGARNVVAEIEKYEGFIMAWTVAGPYAKDGTDVKKLLDEVFPPENPEAKDAEWKPLPANLRNWSLDLTKVFNRGNCAAYLRVVLESPAAQEAILELGSDAGVKVWLNGEVVHTKNVLRGVKPGEDKVKVSLKEGPNTLLLKINHGSGGGWGACACLKKPDGAILVLNGAR